MRILCARVAIKVFAGVILVLSSLAYADPAQNQAVVTNVQPPEPSVQDVYVVMRDMDLAYQNVEIRTIVPTENGASALVDLIGGTLVDVELVAAAVGWTLRDIYYVAGNADEFQSWSGPWRSRVADAKRFLAAAIGEEGPQRRPEELAPLIWFEDIGADDRLWGLNPTTYRIMQTLKMLPNLTGPMGGTGRNR
ncbi:uncharacterized protein METZ01_LOCUS92640 [marine metagenome]|uniref:Uncharacterized protein n=1 Tax=marine metagenome TaxID=408172 RepID=A0A381VHE5_9ZZZZ